MFYRLFINSVRNIVRDTKFDINLILKTLSLLSIIYICIFVFYLGFNFENILDASRLKMHPVDSFNSILIFLFLIGILLLFFFQKRNYSNLFPYLHLPIKRSKIISYILVLTLFNFFNIGFILFFVAFSIKSVLPVYGILGFTSYLLGVVLVLFGASYFVLLLRNLISVKSYLALVPLIVVFLVILLKIVFNVSFDTTSKLFFDSLLHGNIYPIFLIFFSLIGLLTANFSLLKNTIYSINSEDMGVFRTLKKSNTTFFNSDIILYALLEIKLITRNKRLKGFFIIAIGFLFLFYYLLQNKQNGIYFSFIIYIFLTGIFGYIFSQYLFSWESSYFEFILSTKFNILKYIKAKYLVYGSFGIFVLLFFLPLIIQKKIDFHLFLSALLYNSGIGYFVIFYMATFNCSRIELNRNIFLNQQGSSSVQMIALVMILFLPLLMLLILTTFFNITQGLLVINLLSMLSLLNEKKWFRTIVKQFSNRKYINLEGYRK